MGDHLVYQNVNRNAKLHIKRRQATHNGDNGKPQQPFTARASARTGALVTAKPGFGSCGRRRNVVTLAVVGLVSGCVAVQAPPLACRVPVPHAQYASLAQERAQLDAANNLMQFCMAQWESANGRRVFNAP